MRSGSTHQNYAVSKVFVVLRERGDTPCQRTLPFWVSLQEVHHDYLSSKGSFYIYFWDLLRIEGYDTLKEVWHVISDSWPSCDFVSVEVLYFVSKDSVDVYNTTTSSRSHVTREVESTHADWICVRVRLCTLKVKRGVSTTVRLQEVSDIPLYPFFPVMYPYFL